MFLIILFLLIVFKVTHCLQLCDPSYCNYEGQCTVKDNVNLCTCIGAQYFKGPRCMDKVDNCRENPCKNGGECYSLVGQFLCRNCNAGFGGLWCEVEISSLFQNMVLLFNHYGYYSKEHKFLIIVEDLGAAPFALELMADNYAIDSFECYPQQDKTQWRYSSDLAAIIQNNQIRYYNGLPFTSGFYRLVDETFWDENLITLSLRSYDIETASQLYHLQTFSLLLTKLDTAACVPKLKFPHGSNPLEPLMVDIAHFNNFGPVVEHSCRDDSEQTFQWTIFNSIGTKALHNFGVTNKPLLKIPPFKLWFNYHGEVMSSYSLIVRMVERMYNFEGIIEARCFILVLPKPIKAIIKGGTQREIGLHQSLILNGSESTDFALPAYVGYDVLYRWDCIDLGVSTEEITFCRLGLSTNRVVTIESRHLVLKATYQFTLTIQSKVNSFVTDSEHQTVKVVENSKLFIHIQCVRNCLRHQFITSQAIHLRIECAYNGVCSQNARFTWVVDGIIHGNAQRFIYMPKDGNSKLLVTANVWDSDLNGTSSMELTRNLPPAGGRCSIDPPNGIAFTTQFHVKCENYDDIDSPVRYHYSAGDFPLENVNDPETYFRLPPCNILIVEICDQFDACTLTNISVNVLPMSEPENLTLFLMTNEYNVNVLLKDGDRLTTMVLIKSIQSYVNNEAKVLALSISMENLTLCTLIEMKQWLSICYDLSKNMLPLDNRKAFAMLGHIRKFTQALLTIVKDGEVHDMSGTSYENTLHSLISVMTDYAQNWEIIPQTNAELLKTEIKSSDRLAETNNELPVFDIFVLDKIANWLEPCREFHKSIKILSRQAVNVYHSSETATIAGKDAFTMEIYVSEQCSDHVLEIRNRSIQIDVPKDTIEYLQHKFSSNSLVLQTFFMKSNSFWWYPDENPQDINMFYFSAFGSSSIENNPNLQNSFQFKVPQTQLRSALFNHTTGITILNRHHMPILALQLPPNAAIVVNLCNTSVGVHLGISIGKRPRAHQLRKFNEILSSASQSVADINIEHQQMTAYIAALATVDTSVFPISLTIRVNVTECLHWVWDDTNPQWSSTGCRPVINANTGEILACECFHLSSFAFKNYHPSVVEDLNDRWLLHSLPFNYNMAAFYAVLIILFFAILCYNGQRSYQLRNILLTSASDDTCDVEVLIYTGSHWNAGSTSSIHLRFVSERGPYSVTIYQNPQKYQLRRNSLCRLRLSSLHFQMPLKLTITNDLVGRYPTWFCHKIVIVNLRKSQSTQMFHINQWISQKPLEVLPSNSKQTFMEIYWESLFNCYNNWYEFQAIFGPSQYTDLCCFQRSHIWIAQVMVCVCIAAFVYGPTTMETYEEERELYYSLNFTLTELFTLPLSCFLSSLLIKCLFSSL